jgi:hypothetical protein
VLEAEARVVEVSRVQRASRALAAEQLNVRTGYLGLLGAYLDNASDGGVGLARLGCGGAG